MEEKVPALVYSKNSNFTKLYENLLKKGYLNYVNHSPDSRDTIVLGTPEEYIVNVHRF